MKAGPTNIDRNTIARMHREGRSVTEMSSVTRVRREQVQIVVDSVDAGTFKGLRELTPPVTALDAERAENAALKAELDALKSGKVDVAEEVDVAEVAEEELSPQQRAANTRRQNAIDALKD